MPFIDWNGNGDLDSQDIITSVVLDEIDEDKRKNEEKSVSGSKPPATKVALAHGGGCLVAVAAFVGIVIVIICIL